jgi:dipeptidyl-peptidase-3
VTDKKMIGELERLGKDGRDWLVLGAEAEGFESLSLERKKMAYYLYRAAIAGNDIYYQQSHRDALEIKNLLEAIYLHSEGLDSEVKHAVQDYLKYVWINHGQYDDVQGTKIVPNYLTFETLAAAAKVARADGAEFELSAGETLEQKLERLKPSIFDAGFEPVRTEQGAGKDVIAGSAVNFWDRGITSRDMEPVLDFWKNKVNARFGKNGDGTIEPQEYRIGGVFDRELRTISHFLRKALPFAENEKQSQGLRALLDYYQTGDEELFREYSVHWLQTESVVDYLNGFVEQYVDPRGVIGAFEANVSFVADSELIGRLADNALYFEERMPWPQEYKRETVTRPVANVVKVLVETGDSGPYSPAAYNLPNYSDIRRDVGSKNIILLNIETARSEELRARTIESFYLPEIQDVYREHGEMGRAWEVYMHEVIGHGSGKPAASLSGDPRQPIGRAYSALEECRADLVALHHVFDPKLVEIGAFAAEQQRDIGLAMYLGYLQGQLNAHRRYQDLTIREAHDKGRQLVLMYLISGGENGDRDYGVDVVRRNGDFFVEIADLDAARSGVADLLGRLQVIKSTGDGEGANSLFDRFGTNVNVEWRDNIKARAAKLKIPNATAFVFPQLVPVRGGQDGKEMVDVRVVYEEDLTAQQLRWSRLAGVTDEWIY